MTEAAFKIMQQRKPIRRQALAARKAGNMTEYERLDKQAQDMLREAEKLGGLSTEEAYGMMAF